MVKGKKPEDKAKEGAQITIDVENFIRTRDSVVTGLATLQDAIQTLSGAYMKHTNAVLGDHAPAEGIDSTLTKLADNPALLGDLQRQPSPARSTGGDAPAEKKERKKRQHDPNAPKRPLTPFFLYMQTARQIIANDLGPEVPKGAVSSEGTRRWSTMAPDDKQLWTNAYKDNLRLYNARMHSYRNSNPDAKDMTDQDALIYAEEHNIGADTSADAQLVGEASATAINDEDEDAEGEPEPEKEPTPPPKTPKVKASTRKSRGSQPTPASAPESIVPPSASIVPPKPAAPEKEKSPDKKRKRATKKGAAEELAGQEELKVETPKSAPKPRKKKAKADS